jgi:hypothetical protein
MNDFIENTTIKEEHLVFVDHVVKMTAPNILFDEFYDWQSVECVIMDAINLNNLARNPIHRFSVDWMNCV